jgi:peptidoglycan/LPS O-acetylase OafA/YrhL
MNRQTSEPIQVAQSVLVYREFANLDILRTVAVLLVFATHYYDILNGAGATWTLAWHLGQLGVLMFFVHTSLVLMWSLERAKIHGCEGALSFYVRRAMRIYPLSVAFVTFAYFCDARWQPVNLWQSLTLTQYMHLKEAATFPPTVTPLWSLPLEIEMYLVLPFLFLVFRHRPLRYLITLCGLSLLAGYYLPNYGPEFTIFRYVPCFLGGVISWRLMIQKDYRRLPGLIWPFAIAAVASVWIGSKPGDLEFCIGLFGTLLGVAITLFYDTQQAWIVAACKIVARYSYGIYLSHFPIMVYVLSGDGNGKNRRFRMIPPMPVIRHFGRPIDAVLIITFTVAASVVLYHGIEEPGIRLGRLMVARLTSFTRVPCGLDIAADIRQS